MTDAEPAPTSAPAAPPDAATWHVRLPDGRTFGPAPLSVVVGWAREGRVPTDAALAPDGAPVGTPARPVLEVPELVAILGAPPTVASTTPDAATAATGMSTLIPYRNPPALVAYYLGLFALLPVVGILPGAVAFVLGIIGLRRRRANPEVKGAVHAWIGIILGGLLTLAWGALIIVPVVLNP